jgi:peptidoglycan/LPS O-acetylase OafA/YrhL
LTVNIPPFTLLEVSMSRGIDSRAGVFPGRGDSVAAGKSSEDTSSETKAEPGQVDLQPQPRFERFRYLPYLDGLRAVSILLVFCSHYMGPVSTRIGQYLGGWAGVNVFFVISGFLITSLLLQEARDHGTFSFKGFYIRRCLRIFPAYYFYLTFMLIYYGPQLAESATIAGLYLTDIYYMFGLGGISHRLVHTWSLAVEEHFYMLWPVMFYLMGRRALGLSILIIAAAWVWKARLVAANVDWPRLYLAFDTRLDCILIGCVASLLWMDPNRRARIRGLLANPSAPYVAVALLVVSAFFLGGHTHYGGGSWQSLFFWNVRLPLHDSLIALLLLALLTHPASGLARLLSRPVMVWFGRLSYSLYLWHLLGIELGDQLYGTYFPRSSVASICFEFVKLAISVGLASLSYFVIERPFLALKSRWEPKRQGTRESRSSAPAQAVQPAVN